MDWSKHHKSGDDVPTETTYPTGRPWLGGLHPDHVATKPRTSPQFSVPSVLLPPEAAKSPTVHKIHIIGDDERSRFIAHALSGVYDSVEMLGWRKNPLGKYGNVLKTRPGARRDTASFEPLLSVTPRALAEKDNSHIDQLVVTGRGYEAAHALEAVKHRIDENTSVCLMTDGLGVLEDVRKKLFDVSKASPNFILGHMNHRLVYHRTSDSVKELRHGQTQFTLVDVSRFRDKDKTEARLNFVKTLQEVRDLNSVLTPFDQWLRFKLPSVIFESVVEPVCVLLEMSYQGLLQNPPARRMMHRLLSEIILVVENMPEVEGSVAVRDFIHGKGIWRHMYSRIMAKRSQPSELARRIEYGLPTDVEYLNGYFLRQGHQMGLDLPTNVMMRDMIKAKHSMAIEKLNSHIPLEETSVPSELFFRYRTKPGLGGV